MKHAIIIPERGRLPYIQACLASIVASRQLLKSEVILFIASPRDPSPFDTPDWISWVRMDDEPGSIFNKPRYLNAGMDAAVSCGAEVLTFLDCDAIVGSRFLEGVEQCDWDQVTRLCYRVRYFDREVSDLIIGGEPVATGPLADRVLVGDNLSVRVLPITNLRLGFEAYGTPERNIPGSTGEPWGNSQFSMTVAALGDLRWDEGYPGRGMEDMAFMRSIQRKFGPTYRGKIMTDPDHAMLHLEHPYEESWRKHEYTFANLQRYKST